MSRLIDADALREHIEDHITTVSAFCTSQEAYGRTQMKILALRDVDEAPTVDAIPVKWLCEKIKEHTDEDGWQDYLANSFGLCIEEWQKEWEART